MGGEQGCTTTAVQQRTATSAARQRSVSDQSRLSEWCCVLGSLFSMRVQPVQPRLAMSSRRRATAGLEASAYESMRRMNPASGVSSSCRSSSPLAAACSWSSQMRSAISCRSHPGRPWSWAHPGHHRPAARSRGDLQARRVDGEPEVLRAATPAQVHLGHPTLRARLRRDRRRQARPAARAARECHRHRRGFPLQAAADRPAYSRHRDRCHLGCAAARGTGGRCRSDALPTTTASWSHHQARERPSWRAR